MHNYFAVLGVHKGASLDEIKLAYRAQAKLTHPDHAGGDAAAFIRLNEAFKTLTDVDLRVAYEKKLKREFAACEQCQSQGFVKRQVSFTKTAKRRCDNCGGAGFIC